MDIGLQVDSPSVNRAVEILSAIYTGHAAAGKVPKMFYLDLFRELQNLIALKTDTGRIQDASDIVALNKVKQIAAGGE